MDGRTWGCNRGESCSTTSSSPRFISMSRRGPTRGCRRDGRMKSDRKAASGCRRQGGPLGSSAGRAIALAGVYHEDAKVTKLSWQGLRVFVTSLRRDEDGRYGESGAAFHASILL